MNYSTGSHLFYKLNTLSINVSQRYAIYNKIYKINTISDAWVELDIVQVSINNFIINWTTSNGQKYSDSIFNKLIFLKEIILLLNSNDCSIQTICSEDIFKVVCCPYGLYLEINNIAQYNFDLFKKDGNLIFNSSIKEIFFEKTNGYYMNFNNQKTEIKNINDFNESISYITSNYTPNIDWFINLNKL